MSEPQKINVVVSGATTTQVVSPGSNTINLNQGGGAVNVTQSSSSSSVSTTPQSNINVGFLGVQGIAGQSHSVSNLVPDKSILYNENGYVSGVNGFFYNSSANELKVTGNNLLLTNGGKVVLSGTIDQNAFLLRDNNADIFKVDTENKKILLSNNVSPNQYKIGIGGDNPQEKVHISNGNLRVDGDMLVSGHILPLKSGQYNLGSPSLPFKDIYLQGDSIVFVDKEAKITASSTGFSFQVTNLQGQTRTLAEMGTENVGVFEGDGTQLTGVPYTGLTDAGAYIQQSAPDGSEYVTVNYGKTLNYDPSVICSLSSPSDNDNAYFTHVESISRTSCQAHFSESINGNGFILHCHVSPRNPTF
jgi:hypothetical protein